MQRINRRLNLVTQLDQEDGSVYIHTTPLSLEVFEQHFLILSRAFAQIHGQGLGIISGPRVAYYVLKQIAETEGSWEGPTGVKNTLVAEMTRLSNFIAPSPQGGWQSLPLSLAVQQDLLTNEDLREVENMLTFFILASALHQRSQISAIMSGVASLWAIQTSFLNATDFAASLATSTPEGITGAIAASTQSVPS